MDRQNAIPNIPQIDDVRGFRELQLKLDNEWIEEALRTTDRNSVRQRRLPAFSVVWIVIAMALFRDRCVEEVVAHLGLADPNKDGRQMDPTTVGSGAIAQARKRLGVEPTKVLFSLYGTGMVGA